jgi:protein-tyrosine-phosphatase
MRGKTRLPFLCAENFARSQMAEGLLGHLGGDRFEAFSAGCAPAERVDLHAVEAMRDSA